MSELEMCPGCGTYPQFCQCTADVLLDKVRSALTRYVIFPTPQALDAVTLWIAATHAQDAWEHAPRCAVVSPEKRCGKSRLMDIAEALSHHAIVTVNISPAALVRTIGDDPPTLLIDEADTIFGPKSADNHEDLRGIVNSGHQRGRPYIRYDITTRSNEYLPTFCMAMLAGIGDLPDTIMDRSIVVRMRRRAATERVDPYRTRRDRPALHHLRDQLGEWIRGHLDELTKAEPSMPVEDRAADTWEPLFAIANLAGGDWPARASKAALSMVASESQEDAEASLGMRLLADIRDVFEPLGGVSFLPSGELANRLLKIEDAPWNELGLTMNQLSRKLKPYGIRPGHNSAKTARGYHRADFADALSRYVPSETVQPSAQGSDQGKRPDTTPDTSPDTNRPDTSTNTKSPDNRPSPGQGEQTELDAWTVSDAPVCETCGWSLDSSGHETNCGARS